MSEAEIRMQAQMMALVADMNAIMISVEGIKATNQQRAACGEAVAWSEDHFAGAAVDMEGIAEKLRTEI